MVKINIRWSDIDANRHLANSAYINFMSYARIQYMRKAGISQKTLMNHNLGPIVFYEHIYYFKEVMPDEPLYVSVELKGMSDDGRFFQFTHNMYDKKGQNMASCEMMGAWINMSTRKLTALPEILTDKFSHFDRSADYKVLTKEDTRKYGVKPKHIDAQTIKEKLMEI